MTDFQFAPDFQVLAFYSTTVEPSHVRFAEAAIGFYTDLAARENFQLDTTADWTRLNEAELQRYRVVLWLNDFPETEAQRAAFQQYMEQGGGWLGFHVAGYNDKHTEWPWFVEFLGGAVFHTNNWPPLPAAMIVEGRTHPVPQRMPAHYTAPDDEWYMWQPSPRLSLDVKVLVTLDPSNYPLGHKDILTSGDIPVVWTNTRFSMLYLNMGHGEGSFDSAIQNTLFEDALLWLGGKGRT